MRNLFTLFTFVAVTAISISASAHAQDENYYNLITSKTILNLNEVAEKEVQQDRILAKLSIQFESRDNTTVQDKINQSMQNALNELKKYQNIKVSTGHYRIHERYNSKLRSNDGWKGSQEVILDSDNKQEITNAVKTLQNMDFNISSINYYLSRDAASSYRTELINEALKSVQSRAASIAKQLNAKHWHIGVVDVSNQNAPHPTQRNVQFNEMAMGAMAKSVTAPSVEGRDERVSISISVKVILDMKD